MNKFVLHLANGEKRVAHAKSRFDLLMSLKPSHRVTGIKHIEDTGPTTLKTPRRTSPAELSKDINGRNYSFKEVEINSLKEEIKTHLKRHNWLV